MPKFECHVDPMDARQNTDPWLLLVALADVDLRRRLLDGLPHYGWRVMVAAHPGEIPALLMQHQPKALLADCALELPAVVLAAYGIPCVAVLPRQDEQAAIRLIREHGASLCISPPFGVEWLAESLGALRRLCGRDARGDRSSLQPRRHEEGEVWSLQPSIWTLTVPDGESIVLNRAETIFLVTLADNAGQAVSRRDLITALGHDMDYFDSRRLDTMVSRLRVKVNKASIASLPVRSIHAVGYAFVAPIRLVE